MSRSTRRAAACLVVLAAAALAILGCAADSREPRQPATADARAADDAARLAEARALREGREAWCNYLQELYRRGAREASWPGFDACVRTPTTGSAEVSKVAAACSMRVLDGFDGSPFTQAYADRAGLCGAEAISRSSGEADDLARLSSTICRHASACGAAPPVCELRVETTMGRELTTVLGALNRDARGELRRCIARTSCGPTDDALIGCLEPLMDRLLYSSALAPSDEPTPPVAAR